MFYGQLVMNGYCELPSISFCAIGDTFDKAPLQVTEFCQGNKLDRNLKMIYLESGGAGELSGHESYELSAYFYARHCILENAQLPYFFITGDEDFYSLIHSKTIYDIIGVKSKEEKFDSFRIWKELMKKFNVFHLHKPYNNELENDELTEWVKALGRNRIIEMRTSKSVIDVVLGIIALTSGQRTLKSYLKDMEVRGQSQDRIEEIKYALRNLTQDFLINKVITGLHTGVDIQNEEEKETLKIIFKKFITKHNGMKIYVLLEAFLL